MHVCGMLNCPQLGFWSRHGSFILGAAVGVTTGVGETPGGGVGGIAKITKYKWIITPCDQNTKTGTDT